MKNNGYDHRFYEKMSNAEYIDDKADTEIYEGYIVLTLENISIVTATIKAIKTAHQIMVDNYNACIVMRRNKLRVDDSLIDVGHVIAKTFEVCKDGKGIDINDIYIRSLKCHLKQQLTSLKSYQPIDKAVKADKVKPFNRKLPPSMKNAMPIPTKNIRFHQTTSDTVIVNGRQLKIPEHELRITGLPNLTFTEPVLFPRAGNMIDCRLILEQNKRTGSIAIKFQCKSRLSLKYIATHGFPTDPNYISQV